MSDNGNGNGNGRYGWRKLVVAMSALVLGFILAIYGKLTGDYATIVSIAVGSYNLAHAVADYTSGKAGNGATPQ